MIKVRYLLFLTITISACSSAQKSTMITTGNTAQSDSMTTFISDLMDKMTLEEKIGQMNLPTVGFDVTGPILSEGVNEKIKKGLAGGVFNTFTPVAVRKLQELAVNETRLKIPLLFGYDVIHGHRTIFPINLGLAASWDTALIQRTARAAAEEATADGLNWVFSPMVDITRDPRWGRVSEAAGEDPFLGSQIAKAMVRGYQSSDLSANNTVMACVKHFALYGAAEAGRDYNTVDMSHMRMFNFYFPPYKAAIDAHVGSVMTSFNVVDGVPASGNKWLLTEVLRNRWGFDGLVVSDYTSINEMVNHGMGDDKKVTELALNAGMDMDMVGEEFLRFADSLVQEGKVDEKIINEACQRVLEAKYKLGLFHDPYKYVNEERNKQEIMNDQKIRLAREAAVKSMVLLKNNNILPLDPSKKIAFIGPLVKDQRNLIGSWSAAGDYKNAVSLWTALEDYDTSRFTYALGANLVEDQGLMDRLNPHDAQLVLSELSAEDLIKQAEDIASRADVIVAVLGEAFGMSGEAASRSNIGLLPNQVMLLRALKTTGKPIVLVLMNGRPLTLTWEDENMDAILETWFSGTMAGPAIADVLFGRANPQGKLPMTFPRNVGQIPIYYNHMNTGRPVDVNQKYTSKYLDVENTPLYAFGHGLSYTRFTYGEIVLNNRTLKTGDTLTATIPLTNGGSRTGTETVQMYIRDMAGSVSRPVMELKGFQQITLAPGETVPVTFSLTIDDLKFFNSRLDFVYEPGSFKVFIGGSSDKVKETEFIVAQD